VAASTESCAKSEETDDLLNTDIGADSCQFSRHFDRQL